MCIYEFLPLYRVCILLKYLIKYICKLMEVINYETTLELWLVIY